MKWILTLILTVYGISLSGQGHIPAPDVFLDCQTNCFLNYIRQEVNYINYQRDRQDANVYTLVTSQNASAGAREMQLIFIYDEFPGLDRDTIKYIREQNISELEEMQLFEYHFKKGLLPAILQTEIANDLDYDIEFTSETLEQVETEDPWDFWSFNVRFNLNISGESRFSEQGYSGRVSGSRVTEESKITFVTWYNLDQAEFTLSDGETVFSENERYRVFGQYVKSISDHWSAGVRGLLGSSTFGNTDFEATLRPALEFNIFPYSENSTKRFTLMYSTGLVYNDYMEETVFGKLQESRWRQSFDVEFEQSKPWGSLSADIEFDQFLHDLSLLSLSFNPNIELNIIKGLRLEFGGFISFVGDRINISAGEISDQDIILQNRQLNTDYSYATYMGFNYRFGSKNNNIVNPRF